MNTKHTILRFKFSDEVMNMISIFAKIHQFDDRHAYKEHWNTWFAENDKELSEEIQRIDMSGYKGNIQDKMYKAGRYYFRKKVVEELASLEKEKEKEKELEEVEELEEPASLEKEKENEKEKEVEVEEPASLKKRTYIAMNKTFIEEIDKHIAASLSVKYTPANGFNDFCKVNAMSVERERRRLMNETPIRHEMIDGKIKKTYKNRYFICVSKL